MEPHADKSEKLPPDYDAKSEHEPLSRTSSQSAASMSTPITRSHFQPNHSLFIHAQGIAVLRIPGPTSQTSIPITEYSSGKNVYTSVRNHKWGSQWELTHETGFSGEAKVVGRINGDRFSNLPLRAIGIELITQGGGMEVVKMRRKALMTRACVFEYGGWEWGWRYGRSEEGAKMNGHTLLVCERTRAGEKVKIAQLVRDQEMDEKGGTGKAVAGRGGRLDIKILEEKDREQMEVLVVMSCLVMLKKEIDRRRNTHPVPITPAFSGSSA